jgi:PAS domain S-box-containing protein
VISVESEQADAFSPQDERLLATLANQAAVAFENARLYQAAQRELAERNRAESALRTSETHYRDLADSITDIMFEMDHNLQFTHWNKSSELLTGISKAEALGKPIREIFGDSLEQMNVEKIYMNVLMNRAPKSFEVFLNLNQEQRAYEINAYPSTSGVSVVAKDVTERKISEIIMQKRFELMNFSANNSLDDVLQRMLDVVTELIDSPVGFFHFMDEGQSTPVKQMWSTKTLDLLEDKQITVHIAETKAAAEIYNGLASRGEAVGGLFHSTC